MLVLVSWVRPDRISSPITRIAAVLGIQVPVTDFGFMGTGSLYCPRHDSRAPSRNFRSRPQGPFRRDPARAGGFRGHAPGRPPGRRVLDMLTPLVKPGVTTAELDKLAHDYILDHGALPACLGYRGYRHTVCISHQPCGLPRHSRRQAAARRRHRQYRRHRDPRRLAWRHQPHVSGGRGQAQSRAAGRDHL